MFRGFLHSNKINVMLCRGDVVYGSYGPFRKSGQRKNYILL